MAKSTFGHARSLAEISNLHLEAGADGSFADYVGRGIYRRSAEEQQLILFLMTSGMPTVFDSGVVPITNTKNAIDISVNRNDLINYDTLLRIVADRGTTATLGTNE